MRITCINIPEDKENGLEKIEMKKLGQLVILAGKNGAGKTRVLNKIFSEYNIFVDSYYGKDINSYHNQLYEIINNLNYGITSMNAANENNVEINNYQSQIKNYYNIINRYKYFNFNKNGTTYKKPIMYTNKDKDVHSYSKLKIGEIEIAPRHLEKLGIDKASNYTLGAIYEIQRIWHNSTHQDAEINASDKNIINEKYNNLRYNIKNLLGCDLKRNKEGKPTLFEIDISNIMLSEGQRYLLKLAVALHLQSLKLNDAIVVIDEPENHLHPSSVIEIVSKLLEFCKEGQIWLATHSVPLISYFDVNSLWFVENGSVKHAGKVPQNVLNSLLGGEERISRLRDFIDLPAQLASQQFAVESLLDPKVLMTDSQDKQIFQVNEALGKLSTGEKFKLLDYGAGKGRLIVNLYEQDTIQKEILLQTLDYVAFDTNLANKVECMNNISSVYGDSMYRYYDKIDDLFNNHSPHSFDAVILLNVLHEIDPKEWLNIFGENKIQKCLKPNGYLIIIEDYLLPYGEKAYSNGFIILDRSDLSSLFKINVQDSDFITDAHPKNDRLKCHFIPKKYLSNISSETRKEAIKSVLSRAQSEIKSLRAHGYSYENGRKHGFWSQQFVNATFCIDEL